MIGMAKNDAYVLTNICGWRGRNLKLYGFTIKLISLKLIKKPIV